MLHPKIVLAVLALLPSLTLRAQHEPSTKQSPSVPAIKVESGAVAADEMLASWLMAGCDNQIALARIAVRKAHNVEVKQFAQKLLDDHTRLAAKLLPFTGTDAKVGDAARAPAKASADAGNRGRKPAEASSGRPPMAKGEFDHIALIRDLSKRCLESQAKTLEAKTGADFDQSFMQAQVSLHTQAVIMIEVFGDHASDDLRPTLELAGTTVRAHLEQVTTLCKMCDDGAKMGKPKSGQK